MSQPPWFGWLRGAQVPGVFTWKTSSCWLQESMTLASRSTPPGSATSAGKLSQITRLNHSRKVAIKVLARSSWQKFVSSNTFSGCWGSDNDCRHAAALWISVLLYYPASTELQWTHIHSHINLKSFFFYTHGNSSSPQRLQAGQVLVQHSRTESRLRHHAYVFAVSRVDSVAPTFS